MAGRTPAPCARPCAGAPTAQPPDWSAARASLRSALAVLRRSRSAGAASAAAARHRCPTISVTLACVQPHVLARRRRQNVKSVRRLAENLPPVGMRQRVRWCIGFRAERRAHIILQRSEQRRRLLGRLSGERRYPYGAAIGERDRLALPGRCARRERCRRFRQRFRHRMRRARLCSAGHASRMRPVICTNVAGSGDMGSTTRMGEIVHDDGQEHPSRRIRVSCVATDGGDPIVVEIGVSHECGIGGKRLHGGRRM